MNIQGRPFWFERGAFRNPERTIERSRRRGSSETARKSFGAVGIQNLAAGFRNTRFAAGVAVLFGLVLIATRSKWSFVILILMIPLLCLARLRFFYAKRMMRQVRGEKS